MVDDLFSRDSSGAMMNAIGHVGGLDILKSTFVGLVVGAPSVGGTAFQRHFNSLNLTFFNYQSATDAVPSILAASRRMLYQCTEKIENSVQRLPAVWKHLAEYVKSFKGFVVGTMPDEWVHVGIIVDFGKFDWMEMRIQRTFWHQAASFFIRRRRKRHMVSSYLTDMRRILHIPTDLDSYNSRLYGHDKVRIHSKEMDRYCVPCHPQSSEFTLCCDKDAKQQSSHIDLLEMTLFNTNNSVFQKEYRREVVYGSPITFEYQGKCAAQ
jgi:hypothetical protein